jgi:hypothetical protein
MTSAVAIRLQVEARLRDRFPNALSIPSRIEVPVLGTGILALDQHIGGIPCGAMTEVCASSALTTGATSMLISLLSKASEESFCAWVDATDAFNVRWAHSAGTDLSRVLWIRCQDHDAKGQRLSRLDQALHAVDLLLKANCGFGLIVVDLQDVPEKLLGQLSLDVWYRFRLAAEKVSTALVFNTPVPITGTCSALVLDFKNGEAEWTRCTPESPAHTTLLNGFAHEAEIGRQRDKKKRVRGSQARFVSTRRWA